MTKKHFNQLAAALKFERVDVAENKDQHAQWCRDVQAIAGVCAENNARFDRDRFLRAAGLIENTR